MKDIEKQERVAYIFNIGWAKTIIIFIKWVGGADQLHSSMLPYFVFVFPY